MRAWTPSAVTTCSLTRAATGSMTAGSVTIVDASAVNRSVLSTTWWTHRPSPARTIVKHARTRARPESTLRRRRVPVLAAAVAGSGAAVIASTRSTPLARVRAFEASEADADAHHGRDGGTGQDPPVMSRRPRPDPRRHRTHGSAQENHFRATSDGVRSRAVAGVPRQNPTCFLGQRGRGSKEAPRWQRNRPL